jgi:hypothetical protein
VTAKRFKHVDHLIRIITPPFKLTLSRVSVAGSRFASTSVPPRATGRSFGLPGWRSGVITAPVAQMPSPFGAAIALVRRTTWPLRFTIALVRLTVWPVPRSASATLDAAPRSFVALRCANLMRRDPLGSFHAEHLFGCTKSFATFFCILRNLPPMCVFVGANGSGKSTLFDVFGFLHDSLLHNGRTASPSVAASARS